MSKLRNVGIGVLALGLLAGAAVAVNRALGKRKNNDPARELAAATHGERLPTNGEFGLLILLGKAGWDRRASGLKFGTDALGEFVLMPTDYGLVGLRFTAGDRNSFQVDTCDGEHLTSLATVNMTYQDFCASMKQK
ncbi:MAG TPA: hypothetical protein VM581_05275 [Magnetospirillaceae bacterium]|nr:hypothetical protein [Magnetospirillaceae bacterium]